MEHYRFVPPARSLAPNEYALYLAPEVSAAERFRIAAEDYGVRSADLAGMEALLAPLREKHPPTYEHCLRVGLLAGRIGQFLREDARAPFMAGCLHDIGKANVPVHLLQKTEGWTTDDSRAMEPHVLRGYELARGRFDFSADILVHHHRFQPHGYPAEVPAHLHQYSHGTQTKIEYFGRIVALADVYDALHRINARHGEKRAPRGEEIRDLMGRYNPDQRLLIDRLYQAGIFSTFLCGAPHAETEALDAADSLYEESFRHTDVGQRSPRSTRRAVQLACSLEPLPDKGGCTGRTFDVSRHLRLEYFVTAAVNIGDAFEDLAQEVTNAPTLPSHLYRYAARAQLESKRNRRGGRVNHGMIELLTPIIVAQHLHDPQYALTPAEILRLAGDYLTRTDRRDIESLVELKITAHALSHLDRSVSSHADAQTVERYYACEVCGASSITSLAHNREFLTDFPSVQLVADTLLAAPYPHFSDNVDEAYVRLRQRHHPEVGRGFLADCVAVGTYLALSQNPRRRLIG